MTLITPSCPEDWNETSVRIIERASIRRFVHDCRDKLLGRVLDFGAGDQPYRNLVDGEYIPHELGNSFPQPESLDAILCTQVLQYVSSPQDVLWAFRTWLKPEGHLVLTYATNWDEVEPDDLWRFTKAGMEGLLRQARFEILHHERRAEINLGGFHVPLGYGVLARR